MATQIHVVVQMAAPVIVDLVADSPADVTDELPLGHFVLDVRAGQVDGQHDEREANYVHSICIVI